MNCFFTSVNNAYIPKALVWAESVRKIYPDSTIYCILSDRRRDDIDYAGFDRILTPEELDISVENIGGWIFSHTVVELCTAVKPFAFRKIFRETRASAVIYMDPDTVLYSPMDEVYEFLKHHPIVVTPHVSIPATREDDLLDGELLGCLRHGVFNLGYLAIADYGEGLNFLDWWEARCLKYCYDDAARGLFTDQRWIDLAPCFFETLKILRLPTYNVATWNLYYREIGRDSSGRITVNGDHPLRFFHFSGFDIGTHELMLKRHAPSNSVLREMTSWYVEKQRQYGQLRFGKRGGAFDFFPNGDPIQREMRACYRESSELMARFPDPYGSLAFLLWWRQQHTGVRGGTERESMRHEAADCKVAPSSSAYRHSSSARDLLAHLEEGGIRRRFLKAILTRALPRSLKEYIRQRRSRVA